MASVQPPPIPRRKKPAPGPSPESVTPGTSDTPPKSAPKSAPKPRPTQLQKSLEELFSAPALAYSLAGDQWAAEFVAGRAPVLAEAWAGLARENPAVRRILERLTQGSAWGGVIVATGGTVLPLLAHHDLLPAQVSGLISADDSPRGPIVPPPPAPSEPPPPGPVGPVSTRGGGAKVSQMTPPLKEGQPPGVVTVAGTNNGAR